EPGGREDPGLELLLEEDGVGAEVDVLLASDQRLHQRADLRIHEGLAAGNGDHGRPALVHRPQTLLQAEVALQDVSGVLDLAAPRTGEVAAKQGLEHEDQRIALPTTKLLFQDITDDGPHLRCRNTHVLSAPRSW